MRYGHTVVALYPWYQGSEAATFLYCCIKNKLYKKIEVMVVLLLGIMPFTHPLRRDDRTLYFSLRKQASARTKKAVIRIYSSSGVILFYT